MLEAESSGGVARVFLNRPEKANALTSGLLSKLTITFEELKSDTALRAVVLAGRGNAFCGGADVNELAALTAQNASDFVSGIHSVCQAIRDLPVPVVARLHGAVIGAGLEIAAACDLRIAAEGTKFAMPEVRLGIPSVVEAALLPRLIGAAHTRNLVLTGDTIAAPTALAWGLVDQLAAPGDLDAAVERYAAAILAGGPHAIRLQKRLVLDWEDAPSTAAAVQRGIDCFVDAFATDEPHRMAAGRLAEMRARKAR